MPTIGKLVLGLTMAIHMVLALWAAGGLLEWVAGDIAWLQLNNPEIPRPILLAQWVLSLGTALIFVVGVILRLPGTPLAVVIGYTLMAAVCALETTRYLTSDTRYLAMALEYVTYVAIGMCLYRLPEFTHRFTQQARGTA